MSKSYIHDKTTLKGVLLIFRRSLTISATLPGVVDFSDVVVLELVVSSLMLVVGVVTVVTLVVISVVEYSKKTNMKCVLLRR